VDEDDSGLDISTTMLKNIGKIIWFRNGNMSRIEGAVLRVCDYDTSVAGIAAWVGKEVLHPS